MSKKKKKNRSISRKTASASVPDKSTSTEFNPDYSDIKSELKRIGILAGSFITLLVVLSFFQEQILSIFIK